MKPCVIGISGKKGVGKDTVAEMINYIFRVGSTKANFSQYVIKHHRKDIFDKNIYHFADPLKQILSIIYNIDVNLFNNRIYKDDRYYILNERRFIDKDSLKNYKEIIIEELSNKSINDILSIENNIYCIKLRTLMQYFGTNVCRNNLSNDIWLYSAKYKISDLAQTFQSCIVPDVRFQNEVDLIRKLQNGTIISISREETNSEHVSENNNIKGDFEIMNNGSLIQLFYNVLHIVQKINEKR